MTSLSILITGGAGFIGARASRILAARGHRVTVLDNLLNGQAMPADPSIEAVELDIRDTEGLTAAFERARPDVVAHLAAIHHIPTCETERALALDVNVVGTERVLAAAEVAGTGTVLLASSGAVYDWTDGPLNEADSPLAARDNYSLCKFTNESQLRFWGDRTGRRARVARIFNTIGHDDPNAHLIPDVLNQLHRARGVTTIRLGNTAPRRDYIHADDTAAAIAAIATDTDPRPFDIMNIGSGTEASVEGLVCRIGQAMGVEIRIETDPGRVRRVDRPSQLADIGHIEDRLGWRPERDFDQAISHVVRHFAFATEEPQAAL